MFSIYYLKIVLKSVFSVADGVAISLGPGSGTGTQPELSKKTRKNSP